MRRSHRDLGEKGFLAWSIGHSTEIRTLAMEIEVMGYPIHKKRK